MARNGQLVVPPRGSGLRWSAVGLLVQLLAIGRRREDEAVRFLYHRLGIGALVAHQHVTAIPPKIVLPYGRNSVIAIAPLVVLSVELSASPVMSSRHLLRD
jgi:hypothetical protein